RAAFGGPRRRSRAWHWRRAPGPRALGLRCHPHRCRRWRAIAPVDRPRSQCDLVGRMKHLKLLILGGSGEAAGLARALDGDARYDVTLSLAGRTKEPTQLPGRLRRGGLGGAEGLARLLCQARYDLGL